jgi:hypothetical protein
MVLGIIKSGRVNLRVITFIFIIRHIFIPVFSQSLKTIDPQKVSPVKVREYIVSRSFDQLIDFSSIHASWKKDVNVHDFYDIEETFYLRKKVSIVWECYRHINPIKMWNGKSFKLGLLICKYPKSVIYANDLYIPDIDTGQVYFLNLKLIKGLINVPVAFEIINIDNDKRIMEFSYIDSNVARGKQVLEFFDDGEGRTRIVHRTYFKSESWLRDNLFYPYFHFRFIEEFHRNMKKLIKKVNSSDII